MMELKRSILVLLAFFSHMKMEDGSQLPRLADLTQLVTQETVLDSFSEV